MARARSARHADNSRRRSWTRESLVTIDLASRVSRGSEMPDGTRSDLAEAADVIMVFCEDDPGATVRPRLDIAEADVTRIHQLRGTQQPDRTECDR